MVKFVAYLPKAKTAIQIDGDNQARVSLVASADQLPEVLKLTMFQGRAFKVICVECGKEEGKSE